MCCGTRLKTAGHYFVTNKWMCWPSNYSGHIPTCLWDNLCSIVFRKQVATDKVREAWEVSSTDLDHSNFNTNHKRGNVTLIAPSFCPTLTYLCYEERWVYGIIKSACLTHPENFWTRRRIFVVSGMSIIPLETPQLCTFLLPIKMAGKIHWQWLV